MLNSQNVYEIAKKYRAEITAGRQIQWLDMGDFPGEWHEKLQYRPSVLDSLILEGAIHEPKYMTAAMQSTGWPRPMIVGFQTTMLLGRPFETEDMYIEGFMYWKGVVYALMVIEKLRSRHQYAESFFNK